MSPIRTFRMSGHVSNAVAIGGKQISLEQVKIDANDP